MSLQTRNPGTHFTFETPAGSVARPDITNLEQLQAGLESSLATAGLASQTRRQSRKGGPLHSNVGLAGLGDLGEILQERRGVTSGTYPASAGNGPRLVRPHRLGDPIGTKNHAARHAADEQRTMELPTLTDQRPSTRTEHTAPQQRREISIAPARHRRVGRFASWLSRTRNK